MRKNNVKFVVASGLENLSLNRSHHPFFQLTLLERGLPSGFMQCEVN
tara:strand:- start:248 stop:388 length:141 start_codon:yes stop_codon:yes gene_type:complete